MLLLWLGRAEALVRPALQMMSRVASPYQAHYEIKRILKPGGSHIFTVPFSPVSHPPSSAGGRLCRERRTG